MPARESVPTLSGDRAPQFSATTPNLLCPTPLPFVYATYATPRVVRSPQRCAKARTLGVRRVCHHSFWLFPVTLRLLRAACAALFINLPQFGPRGHHAASPPPQCIYITRAFALLLPFPTLAYYSGHAPGLTRPPRSRCRRARVAGYPSPPRWMHDVLEWNEHHRNP